MFDGIFIVSISHSPACLSTTTFFAPESNADCRHLVASSAFQPKDEAKTEAESPTRSTDAATDAELLNAINPVAAKTAIINAFLFILQTSHSGEKLLSSNRTDGIIATASPSIENRRYLLGARGECISRQMTKKVSGYKTRNLQWQDLNSKNAFACDA
jgi:hypothetical protein